MHLSSRPRRTRAVAAGIAATAALALVAGLLVAPVASASAPPPNPTNSQLQSAAQQKANLAHLVGQLAAEAAEMQAKLQQLQDAKELAEQKVALALYQLAQAKAAAVVAQRNVALAQQRVVAAQHNFVGYVQAVYMDGELNGTTGILLTASNPSQLLAQSALQGYQASHELSAVGQMQLATVARSNADAAARRAVTAQTAATNAAQVAEQQAAAAVQAEQAAAQQVQSSLSATQTKLQTAQVQLATLNHERAKFLAYQREQAILAAEAAARARAAALAAQRRAESGGGGGSSTGPYVPPGSAGGWTLQAGQAAAARALRYLGWPYAWAGGNAQGPTYGVCDAAAGAPNDCNVNGFDCSGLAMYAWAQYPLVHYAATQYLQGSVHPDVYDLSQLAPGDLIFWSSDGTVGGIHHVAIYIGSGNVVQAPESGELIQVTPIYQVDSGLFGATRPGT